MEVMWEVQYEEVQRKPKSPKATKRSDINKGVTKIQTRNSVHRNMNRDN